MPAAIIKATIAGSFLSLMMVAVGAGTVRAMDPLLLLNPADLMRRADGEQKPGEGEQTPLRTRPVQSKTERTSPKGVVPWRSHPRKSLPYPVSGGKGGGTPEKSTQLTGLSSTSTETVDAVISLWPRLIGAGSADASQVSVSGKNYSLLSIDPSRYPTLSALDGARIIIDPGGAMDPLVKSILQSGRNKVRVVTESPVDMRPFIRSLLASAGLFSVEENFDVSFGIDPEVKVHADFKVERTRESLLKEELVLLNVADNGQPLPPSLVTYLQNEGFEVFEPFARQEPTAADRGRLCMIRAKDPLGIADGLLNLLAIPVERQLDLELFGYGESGLAMNMTVDRYFEKNGERFAISSFNGDPVEHTLTRLLENRGYNVIELEKKDDLARVAGKILAKLKMQGNFGSHDLWEARENSYGIQLSGVWLNNDGNGRKLFLTGLNLDPLVRELADINGYQVVEE